MGGELPPSPVHGSQPPFKQVQINPIVDRSSAPETFHPPLDLRRPLHLPEASLRDMGGCGDLGEIHGNGTGERIGMAKEDGGAQQQLENTAAANADEVQPLNSGLCLPSGESVIAPAERKRLARATAGNKLKAAKKDMADSNLPEGPSTSQKDGGSRRTKKDILEQESAGAPCTAGALATGADIQIEQEQTGQPGKNVSCSPAPGSSGQGLQVGLGKMMEAMHSFMASAKVLAGLGSDDQGSSSRRAGAGQLWGQGSNFPPKGQGEDSVNGAEASARPAADTIAGANEGKVAVRPNPPLLSGRSSLAWRVSLEVRERIWNREFIDILSLLIFAKEGADITVPSKEVEKHKWKRTVKPEESIDNWLEAFAMLSTVIMEKFPEQGPALCKYNRVIYEEYTRNGGTRWLNYDREFRQKMEQTPEMAWDCREIELWMQ
ncbi:hypothetical protein NDU88_000628 [Pleurodeles waltl]|uniref:Uncharacterized protein n=1 Tax=Pleurodeles waltl TaxID=8319 RepID=A0AAV7S5R8_PLEWA|nr:hypothetical protein NDU88_000628 [Pleurodeles waltl]